MKTIVKALTQDTPLKGVVLDIASVLIAIHAPTERNMIEHHLVAVVDRHSVGTLAPFISPVTQAYSYVTNNDIRTFIEAELVVFKRDPVARGRLARNSKTLVRDLYRRFQRDGAGDFENDGPRPSCRIDPLTKRSRPRVV